MQRRTRRTTAGRAAGLLVMLLVLLVLLVGCRAEPSPRVLYAVRTGDMSQARVQLQAKIGKDVPPRPTPRELEDITEQREADQQAAVDPRSVDRTYVLDRARLLGLMLGDGYNAYAEPVAVELNNLLRTQGLNANKRIASVLINEDVKVWKGEPFEQAMAMCWIGMHFAMRGDWDNARTASDNALFQLRDFGTYETEDGERRYDAATLARHMAEGKVPEEDVESDSGYQLVDSNFVLGYLMTAIANQQLGRQAEADDNYARALRYNAALGPTIEALKGGRYNTILVVEYGTGPQKRGTGPDNAIATFARMTPSDAAPLTVRHAGASVSAPPAMDLNTIATDLMWNSLEDVRLAKSTIGTALVVGGSVVAAKGLEKEDLATTLIGVGVALTGAYLKGKAHADTRYNEATPQRVYVLPITVNSPAQRFTLGIEGKPGSGMTISGLRPPRTDQAALHYVRLPSAFYGRPPRWAATGEALYATDARPDAGRIALPYIMGGHCVMTPTYEALKKYQDAGYLAGYTLQDLIDLYRAEGIAWQTEAGGLPGLHVLDGGDSLIAPEPGTTGYTRLMGQPHPPYVPKSAALRRAIAGLPPLPDAAPPANPPTSQSDTNNPTEYE